MAEIKDKNPIDDKYEKILFGTRVPTSDQRNAVETDGKVIVAASAGSGKTSTMIKKIIREILRGTPLSRMLILVYNEAAADEIKEKLHDALFDAACLADGEKRAELRRNLDELSFANIGTIHAFCRGLIKDNFEKLGISPSFDVLDERRNAVYEKRALDAVFARYSEEGDEVFLQLADILSRNRKEDGLRAVVGELHSLYEIQPDRSAFVERIRQSFDSPTGGVFGECVVRESKKVFASALRMLENAVPALAATGQTKYVEKVNVASRICKECLNGEFADILAAALRNEELPKATKTKGGDEYAVECVKKACTAITDELAEWRDNFVSTEEVEKTSAQNAAFVCKLAEIAVRFDEELSAIKLADDVLSFSDLEKYAAELIRGGGDYADLYDIVFVDEYQDVNPVQEYIISSLVKNNAFMVGDVKQSIYGFRLAAPEIFLSRKDRYEHGEGSAIGFARNFRSENGILAFVNAVFDSVMTSESADVDYAADGHFDISGEVERKDNVQIHLFAPESGRSKESLGEGAFIAREIKTLVGSAITDGRRMEYSDCAVLFRSRNEAARKIIEVLRAEGIPVDDAEFRQEASRPERDIINFLTVLDNPRQDIPLAGFMLSYFGGYNEDELAEIAVRKEENGIFYDAVLKVAEEQTELGEKVRSTLEMLDRYRLKASFKSVPELMQSIVGDFAFDAYMTAKGEGMVSGVLSFITSKVAGKDECCGISKFLAAYNEEEKQSEKRSVGGNRVCISTYHGFKGLEAPVVFVADVAAASHREQSGDVIRDNSGYVGIKYYDLEKRTVRPSLSFHAVKKMKEARERKEEMRLFYVALTRAKQYLYISGSPGKTAVKEFGLYPCVNEPASSLEYLSAAAFDGGLGVRVIPHIGESEAAAVGEELKLPLLNRKREEDVASIKQAVNFVYPHKEATALSMKYSVSALDGGGDELTLGIFSDKADEGTLYHKVMEEIDFRKQGVDGVRGELARMVSENVISEDEAASVDAEVIARCLDSPLMEAARNSVCYREKSFLMYVPACEVGQGEEKDKILVQGVVDLIIDGKEKIIVDFKNSELRSAEAMEKYKKQLNLYKKAVESALFAKIDKTVLYSFKLGKAIEVSSDD